MLLLRRVVVEQRPARIRVVTKKDYDQILLKIEGVVRADMRYEVLDLREVPAPFDLQQIQTQRRERQSSSDSDDVINERLHLARTDYTLSLASKM